MSDLLHIAFTGTAGASIVLHAIFGWVKVTEGKVPGMEINGIVGWLVALGWFAKAVAP